MPIGAVRGRLVALSGAAFDGAYAKSELDCHRLLNETVALRFLRAVTVEPVKALLEDALVTFRAHERHAAHLVQGPRCGG